VTLPDLASTYLLTLGGLALLALVVYVALMVSPLGPAVRMYQRRLWGPVAKYGALALLILAALAGFVLAVWRLVTAKGPAPVPAPVPSPDLPDPVPSSEEEREAIRTETRRETQEIRHLREIEGVTVGDMRGYDE
jgi:hypothetical protein